MTFLVVSDNFLKIFSSVLNCLQYEGFKTILMSFGNFRKFKKVLELS